jgi:hypothetical protein
MRATLRLLCRRRRQAHKDTDEPQRVCAIGTARTERPNSASEKISRLRCWTKGFTCLSGPVELRIRGILPSERRRL